jgi:uncharacterized membrane protein YeaQ/YmgE (transglycosylase-associated protein family)
MSKMKGGEITMKKIVNMVVGAIMAIAIWAGEVFASATTSGGGTISTPGTTGFAGILYDLGVVNILHGPIGFVIGTGIFCFAGYMAFKQEVVGAIIAGLGALIVLNADSLVSSLSAII